MSCVGTCSLDMDDKTHYIIIGKERTLGVTLELVWMNILQ